MKIIENTGKRFKIRFEFELEGCIIINEGQRKSKSKKGNADENV